MARSSGATATAAPEVTARAVADARAPRRPGRWRKRIELTLLLGPALVLFVGFVIVPMVIAAWYSFYSWSGYGPLTDFVGLSNYSGVLMGPVFHESVLHNLIIAFLTLLIQLPISIGLALLLNRQFRGRMFLRVAVFTPSVLSEATAARR